MFNRLRFSLVANQTYIHYPESFVLRVVQHCLKMNELSKTELLLPKRYGAKMLVEKQFNSSHQLENLRFLFVWFYIIFLYNNFSSTILVFMQVFELIFLLR